VVYFPATFTREKSKRPGHSPPLAVHRQQTGRPSCEVRAADGAARRPPAERPITSALFWVGKEGRRAAGVPRRSAGAGSRPALAPGRSADRGSGVGLSDSRAKKSEAAAGACAESRSPELENALKRPACPRRSPSAGEPGPALTGD
jgi:hypothetical protein